jgi:chromatin segregation and condensation protein Rec8/ScpA/Scc1 (kleisin family)
VDFRVEQERYQGPLELLVSLCLERDLPLPEISLARIAKAFQEELRGAGDLPLGDIGDFAVLSARLIRLKAAWQRGEFDLSDEDGDVTAVPRAQDAPEVQVGTPFLHRRMRQAVFLHPVRAQLASYPPIVLVEAMDRVQRRARRLGRRARLRPRQRMAFRRVLLDLRRALRTERRLRIAAPGRVRREGILEILGALELTRLGETLIEQERLYGPLYLVAREEETLG